MPKKAKKFGKKTTSGNKIVAALSPSALKKKLGATSLVMSGGAANSPTHQKGSAIVAPGPNGTTIVCFFNENTGNFDDCHTVPGKVGLAAN
ncbi:MAG TPA: hypothetical protein VFQ87_12185 [Bradyrhizobium sp.]|jgi:hypothetical protein|nr:hypothetical protein [Bradyrhizobium sp.]